MAECQKCKYWSKSDDQPWAKTEGKNEIVIGKCQRHAPHPSPELLLAAAKWPIGEDGELSIDSDTPIGDRFAIWPVTDRQDWCGDFMEKTTWQKNQLCGGT